MSQGFGIEAHGEHLRRPHRQPARYLVIIDAAGSMVARLFLDNREQVAVIEGLVHRIQAEYEAPLKVVATGGLAPLLAEGTTVIGIINLDLTLDGLRLLAERNPIPTYNRDRTRITEGD